MLLTLSDNNYQVLVNHISKTALLITNQYPFKEICKLNYSKNSNELLEQAEAEYLLRNLRNKELKPVTYEEFKNGTRM
jgi:hypothetical protein